MYLLKCVRNIKDMEIIPNNDILNNNNNNNNSNNYKEYWEESWRLGETCCHSNANEKPSAKTDAKNSQGVNSNKQYWQHED